jgi:outer membrane protein assembly factor BamE (lipoprotein component of BamABCDE complex)
MRISVLAGCLALVVLGGCATATWREGRRQWWTLNERDFAAITREKTAAEVEIMLGTPLLVETYSNLREKVWDYRFLNGVVGRYAAEVHFDMDGKVTYVVTYPDHCPLDAVGCP